MVVVLTHLDNQHDASKALMMMVVPPNHQPIPCMMRIVSTALDTALAFMRIPPSGP